MSRGSYRLLPLFIRVVYRLVGAKVGGDSRCNLKVFFGGDVRRPSITIDVFLIRRGIVSGRVLVFLKGMLRRPLRTTLRLSFYQVIFLVIRRWRGLLPFFVTARRGLNDSMSTNFKVLSSVARNVHLFGVRICRYVKGVHFLRVDDRFCNLLSRVQNGGCNINVFLPRRDAYFFVKKFIHVPVMRVTGSGVRQPWFLYNAIGSHYCDVPVVVFCVVECGTSGVVILFDHRPSNGRVKVVVCLIRCFLSFFPAKGKCISTIIRCTICDTNESTKRTYCIFGNVILIFRLRMYYLERWE